MNPPSGFTGPGGSLGVLAPGGVVEQMNGWDVELVNLDEHAAAAPTWTPFYVAVGGCGCAVVMLFAIRCIFMRDREPKDRDVWMVRKREDEPFNWVSYLFVS